MKDQQILCSENQKMCSESSDTFKYQYFDCLKYQKYSFSAWIFFNFFEKQNLVLKVLSKY